MTASSARDPSLDNAKLAAVTLVVLGHALEPFLDTSVSAGALYRALYLFHVPVLVFLAGITSRVPRGTTGWMELVRAVLLPYLLFQLLYTAFDAWVLDRSSFAFRPLVPYWLLWFLVSLFTWRALLPWVSVLRGRWIWVSAAALGAGLFSQVGYELSLSRTLVFFPFILAGYAKGNEILAGLRRPLVRRWAVVTFVAGFALSLAVLRAMDVRWLYASWSYAQIGVGPVLGVLTRAAVLLGGAVIGAAFLACLPVKEDRLTSLGTRSLQTYLLHGFVVRGLAATVPAAVLARADAPLIAAAAAIALSLALSTPWARFVTAPVWMLLDAGKLKRANDLRPTTTALRSRRTRDR